MRETIARVVFALTAVCAAVGVSISVGLAATAPTSMYVWGEPHTSYEFGSVQGRIFNVLCYFTIASNVIMCVIAALLAINLNRTSTIFRAWRVTGLVMIIITGLVYNLVLAGLTQLTNPWSILSNDLEHIVVPLLSVLGWLIFGPRIPLRLKILLLSLVWPLLWVIFSLIRGGAYEVPGQLNDHWYAYPFIDVAVIGYPRAIINIAVICVFYLALALGILALDKVLPGRDPTPEPKPVST